MKKNFAAALAITFAAAFAGITSAQDAYFNSTESSFGSDFGGSPSIGDFSSGCGNGSCGSSDEACNAVPGTGRYFSVFGGFLDVDNFERKTVAGGSTFIDGAKLRDGWAGGAALGRQLHPNMRGEFEFTYRENSVKSWFEQEFDGNNILVTNDAFAATGSVSTYSGMFNVIFDCYQRTPDCIGLYLGGGLGGLYADGGFTSAAAPPETFAVQDSSFAYQFIAGVNYAFSEQLDLFTEYRYLGADYLNVDNLTTGASMGDFNYDSHNVFFGVRIRR